MPANDAMGIPMDAILKILNTTVISVGDGPGLTVLQISVAVVTLLAGIWLSRWSERKLSNRLEQRQVDPGVVQLMRRLFYIVVILVLAATALGLLGIPLGAFAFVSGAIAIGVGFGAQNVISNFISGWILLTERPIRVGDFVELGEMLGTVEAIYTRFTRVRRIDGVRLMIPNSQVLENTIVNWTIVDRKLRSSVRVGVRYGSDVQKVRILLEEILTSNPDVLDDPAPVIIFEDSHPKIGHFAAFVARFDSKLIGYSRKMMSSLHFRSATCMSTGRSNSSNNNRPDPIAIAGARWDREPRVRHQR
jgi:small-conductance mechanosensitive channel